MKFPPRLNAPLPLIADPWLSPYRGELEQRRLAVEQMRRRLTGGRMSLADFASGHEFFGLHRTADGWVFRERAPFATGIFLVGDATGWREDEAYRMQMIGDSGEWELHLAPDQLAHGQHYQLHVCWPGGGGVRLPSFARYVVQDATTGQFSAMVWEPPERYRFRHHSPAPAAPLIYEAHPGMAQEKRGVGTFAEFREQVLPRIVAAGYNTIQLMAVMSHPYYGSFGYHVANYFSIYGGFGTPDDFRELVDAAHGMGLRVIMDLVHSHSVRNEVEGIACFDGTRTLYFHHGSRGEHAAWDSLCFDYGKPEVLHFLLSNCRFWLEEYHIDGFRFDGVTSMVYRHHGLGRCFTSYEDYFDSSVDGDALTYLTLANELVHTLRPDAVTVAEDVSGMPGMASPAAEGGCGFDYRLAMGISDMWFRLFDRPDEDWDLGYLYHEVTAQRADERTIGYVECHDQAIVGGQTAIFRLAGAAMYDGMHRDSGNDAVDRAVALHKMIRLATAAACGNGYLNFMGNEFGHPEWIDFPRAGNQWTYDYARRQWSLADDPALRYSQLAAFDREMLGLLRNDADFYDRAPQLVRRDEPAKVLIFERDSFLFVFNFHPVNSVSGYAFEALPGIYDAVFNSDEPRFGGFGRIAPEQCYRTMPCRYAENEPFREMLRLYLPCRTVQVLRRRPPQPLMLQ